MGIKIEDIVEKKVFVQAIDEENDKKLFEELFDNEIPYNDFYNSRDRRTAYKISEITYQYLLEQGLELEVIEVRNIGDLSLEERNRIKQEHQANLRERQQKVLERLRAEYGEK